MLFRVGFVITVPPEAMSYQVIPVLEAKASLASKV